MDWGLMHPPVLPSSAPVEWSKSANLVPYEIALEIMEDRVSGIARGAPELVWLLEHPPLYTAGTSAKPADLLDMNRFPVYRTGRGGEFTYHGPGQRVAYVMLDLKRRTGQDVRAFVRALERWLILALCDFGVAGGTRVGQTGVWVSEPDGLPAKIAAIGLRVRHGVSFHGASLNVSPDLDHYAGIVPCGIREFPVTSLAALGVEADMKDVDISLERAFASIFGPVQRAGDPLRDRRAAESDAARSYR
jgi:lipoyl(octanoyl) transferase